MDIQIRRLERLSLVDPGQRAHLLNRYIRSQTGRALFWMGNKPFGDAVPCTMVHKLDGFVHGYPNQHEVWLSPVSTLEDVEQGIKQKANGIVNFATGEQHWFYPKASYSRPSCGDNCINSRANLVQMPNLAGPRLVEDFTNEGFFEVKTFPAQLYGSGYLRFWEFDADINKRPTHLIPSGSGVSLPYPYMFLIHGISVTPTAGCDAESYQTLVNNTRFRFTMGTREYVNVPTMFVAGAVADSSGGGLRTTINAPMQPVLTLPEELEIIPLQHVQAYLACIEPFTLEKPVEVLMNFHGHYRREIN